MSTIEQSVDVEVPIRVAYDQWTQFEDFPRFMKNVDEVHQIDDTHLRWKASMFGKDEEWDAEITEQHPDHRIAWRSTSGARNAGVVTFHRIDDRCTRVMLQLDVEPEGLGEKLGDALGVVSSHTKADLGRFKELVESGEAPTGSWRGDVENPAADGGSSATAGREDGLR